MSKKVLIMSASTGGGHNRAARAIKEELESRTINDMSIECEIVDAVEILTPNCFHIEMAKYAAQNKKAVEIEKPLSTDFSGVDELIKVIENNNTVNMMCFSYRFKPAVRYAKKLIEEGKTFEEVVSISEERKHHMCQFFTVDDLTYLKKGGRISGATAAIGTLLNIKPLLRGDEEGHIVSWGKCRGINKCILEIVKKYDELVFDKSADVMMIHGDNMAAIDFLTEKLRENGFTGNTTVMPFEPVCGCHVGPGSVALFFWGERKL